MPNLSVAGPFDCCCALSLFSTLNLETEEENNDTANNIKTLTGGNHTTQNKTRLVLRVSRSIFVEMLVTDVTVTCK